MPDTFQLAHRRIKALNRLFRAAEEHYTSPGYSESQARQDFIDKFWIALGWDVAHERETNPYRQEVKVERSQTFEGRRQHADYTFLAANFQDVLFFVEAKKPSVEIDSPDYYFQVLKYGWPNGVPVSVLTDYRRFRVIDTRFKPRIDNALDRGIDSLSFNYLDFDNEDEFAKVYWLFSRDAVLSGSIKDYSATMPAPRGSITQRRLFKADAVPFDEDFLSALEGFRRDLARCLKRDNENLTGTELTEVVQRILDRVVFMRFLEDKLIEPDPIVSRLGELSPSSWDDFVAQSRRLDRVYNGIIFKRHALIDAKQFRVDELVFNSIRDALANEESPYGFEQIPIPILGSIYERFLGSTIVITGNKADVVQKPEVRKAGGVYYTPEYIVREIVDNSLSPQLAGRSPDELVGFRVCDLACGSGSFLLGVYDKLLRHYSDFYNQPLNKRAATKQGCIKHADGSFHLSLLMRREILLRHIFGVDLDSQAVEVAQLSLYLKLLEDETTASARQNQLTLRDALLPSLSENIKCGNALMESDSVDETYDSNLRDAINPLDFHSQFRATMRAGGFDAIVGNPPYDVLEKDRGQASWPHDLLHDYVRTKREFVPALGGKLNLYRLFIVRALSLVRQGGRLGMIVPLSLMADISCSGTRKYLLQTSNGLKVKCFPQKDDRNNRVFKDAKLSTMIFQTQKRPPSRAFSQVTIDVYPGKSLSDPAKHVRVRPADAALLDPKHIPLPLVDSRDWELCVRLHNLSSVKRLGEIEDFAIRRGEVNQKVLEAFITNKPIGVRLLRGTEIAMYHERDNLSQGEHKWFRADVYLPGHHAWTEVGVRRIALQRITGIDERFRLVGTIIEPPCYFSDSTNSIALAHDSLYSLEYLLAILNSSILQWRFKLTSTNNNVGTNELEALPFRQIDFSDPAEKRIHSSITKMAREIRENHIRLKTLRSDREITVLGRRIGSLVAMIEEAVGSLYGLTETEIHYMLSLVAR